MEYKVKRILDRYFYEDEEGRLYGDKDGRGFLRAGRFQEGLAIVQKEDGNYYYIDEMFREKFGPFDSANSFRDGVASVQRNNDWYFIDKTGQVVAGPFKEVTYFSEGMVAVRKNDDKWYYFDKQLKEVAGPFKEAFDFHEGLAPAKKEDDQWYYIDKAGKEALGPYDFADEFSENLAVVRKKDKFYFINKEGQEVLGPFKHASSFSARVAVVKKEEDEKWYAIDRTGKILSEPYEEAKGSGDRIYLRNGYRADYRVDKNGKVTRVSFLNVARPRLSEEEIAALEEDTLKRLAEGRKRLAELEAEEAERKE